MARWTPRSWPRCCPSWRTPGPELAGGAAYDGLRFAGLELTGDATDARFLECELTGCDLDGRGPAAGAAVHLPARDCRATAVSAVDGTWLDVVVTGGRLGALTAHGAGLTRVLLDGVKPDYLDLRGGTLTDVELRGCTHRRAGPHRRPAARPAALRDAGRLAGARAAPAAATSTCAAPRSSGWTTSARWPAARSAAASWSAWAEGFAAHLGIRVAPD